MLLQGTEFCLYSILKVLRVIKYKHASTIGFLIGLIQPVYCPVILFFFHCEMTINSLPFYIIDIIFGDVKNGFQDDDVREVWSLSHLLCNPDFIQRSCLCDVDFNPVGSVVQTSLVRIQQESLWSPLQCSERAF